MTISKWRNIPQLPRAHYEIDIEWVGVERMLVSWGIGRGLIDLSPDYQREHVWTEAQRVAYIEYVLAGGEVGRSTQLPSMSNFQPWKAQRRPHSSLRPK